MKNIPLGHRKDSFQCMTFENLATDLSIVSQHRVYYGNSVVGGKDEVEDVEDVSEDV